MKFAETLRNQPLQIKAAADSDRVHNLLTKADSSATHQRPQSQTHTAGSYAIHDTVSKGSSEYNELGLDSELRAAKLLNVSANDTDQFEREDVGGHDFYE